MPRPAFAGNEVTLGRQVSNQTPQRLVGVEPARGRPPRADPRQLDSPGRGPPGRDSVL